jgi:hypothetical protein
MMVNVPAPQDSMRQILNVIPVTTNVLPAQDLLLLVIHVRIQPEKGLPVYVKIHTIIVEYWLLVLLVHILVKTVLLILIVKLVKLLLIEQTTVNVRAPQDTMTTILCVLLASILVIIVTVIRNVPYVLSVLKEVQQHQLVVVMMAGTMLVLMLTVLNVPILVLNVKIQTLNVQNVL